ncbi:MAG: PilZ domain-containing protein [Devosia sp.]
MAEQRAADRRRVLKGARIVFNNGGSTINCTVRNLSAAGALIRVETVVGIPDAFVLVVADGTRQMSEVVRRSGNDIGIRFVEAKAVT